MANFIVSKINLITPDTLHVVPVLSPFFIESVSAASQVKNQLAVAISCRRGTAVLEHNSVVTYWLLDV